MLVWFGGGGAALLLTGRITLSTYRSPPPIERPKGVCHVVQLVNVSSGDQVICRPFWFARPRSTSVFIFDTPALTSQESVSLPTRPSSTPSTLRLPSCRKMVGSTGSGVSSFLLSL